MPKDIHKKEAKHVAKPDFKRKELTLHQKQWVKSYLEGNSASQAVRDANYNCTTRDSEKSLGWIIKNNPKVAMELQQVFQENGLTDDKLGKELAGIIFGSDTTPRDKLAGIRTKWEAEGRFKTNNGSTAIQINIGDKTRDLSDVGAHDLYEAERSLERQLEAVRAQIQARESVPEIQEILNPVENTTKQ